MELAMVALSEKLLRNSNYSSTPSINVLLAARYHHSLCQTSVKRVACGIWKCRACKITFAGGSFEFATSVATTAKVTMNRLKKLKEELNAPKQEEKQDKKEKKAKTKEKVEDRKVESSGRER